MGTGNDLANSMGFGCTVTLDYRIKQLQRVLYTYLVAVECKVDVWELIVKIEDYGKISQITSNGPMIMYDENNKILKTWKKALLIICQLDSMLELDIFLSKKELDIDYLIKLFMVGKL